MKGFTLVLALKQRWKVRGCLQAAANVGFQATKPNTSDHQRHISVMHLLFPFLRTSQQYQRPFQESRDRPPNTRLHRLRWVRCTSVSILCTENLHASCNAKRFQRHSYGFQTWKLFWDGKALKTAWISGGSYLQKKFLSPADSRTCAWCWDYCRHQIGEKKNPFFSLEIVQISSFPLPWEDGRYNNRKDSHVRLRTHLGTFSQESDNLGFRGLGLGK